MSRTNETRPKNGMKLVLDASVCNNNKQRWNNDKYRCEWKELIY